MRPLLKSEAHLPYKLRIARLLARHGMADGYALATEHLADDEHTAAAALVLAALDDPRTSKDLSAIVAARPDRRWHAAALTGLAAIGDAAARKQLLEILADDRHPLAADAAEAAGLAADERAAAPVGQARAIAKQANRPGLARGAAQIFERRPFVAARSGRRGAEKSGAWTTVKCESPAADIPAQTRDALADAVASLVADAYVEAEVRQEAFAVARLLGGENYSELLSDLADQAELEGTPLLAAVQAEGRRTAAE